MCDKIPFATKSEASHQAKQFSRHGKVSMQEYYCDQCKAYHLKTRGKRKLFPHKKAKYPVYMPNKIEKK